MAASIARTSPTPSSTLSPPAVAVDAPLVFLSRVESIKGAHWAIEIARRSGRRLVIAGNHAAFGTQGVYWTGQIEPWIGRDGIEYVGPVDDVQKEHSARRGFGAGGAHPVGWPNPESSSPESPACGTPVYCLPVVPLARDRAARRRRF